MRARAHRTRALIAPGPQGSDMTALLSLATLACVGAAAGVIAGLVGLAGGIVVVPTLTWLYGPSVLHTAIAISWFCVLFNSIGAASKQLRIRTQEERRELLTNARPYLLGTVLVTPLVALAATEIKQLVSRPLVAALQLCLALVMFLPSASRRRIASRHRCAMQHSAA